MNNCNTDLNATKQGKCAICDSTSNDPFLMVPGADEQSNEIFTLVKCSVCGLVFSHPQPTVSNRPINHPKDYWIKKGLARAQDQSTFSARFRKLLLRLLHFEEIQHIRRHLSSGKRILEIGCGNADFLSLLDTHGYKVTGIEPDPVCFGVAQLKHNNLDLINSIVETAHFSDNSFDAVLMIHVFEHVATPNSTLKEIHRILKDDGKLFIYVPNLDCYQFRFFREHHFSLYASQHLYQYTPTTLIRLLKKNGFKEKIVSQQSIRCNSATMVCSLFPSLNPVARSLPQQRFKTIRAFLAFFLTALLIPLAAVEALIGHGANMFLLSEKAEEFTSSEPSTKKADHCP